MTWPEQGSVQALPRAAFTCASCHSLFENSETQRTHYQSDWHRYNLRRKVSDLPPVTDAVYKQRLGSLETSQANTQALNVAKTLECVACRKTFASENAYENHVKSKKHVEALALFTSRNTASDNGSEVSKKVYEKSTSQPQEVKQEEFLDANATEEQIKEALETKLSTSRRLKAEDCIFCNKSFESFEMNMEHMTKEHCLYIPDLDYVADLPALVGYLADKVGVAFCCLYCSGSMQPFTSLGSVRRHMLDKGHLKVRFDEEGMQELADFYDYEEYTSDDGDEDFVDVSGEEGEEGDYYEGNSDGTLIISPDENELILPSGKRLGHRAFRRYYKQNLALEETPRRSRRGEHQALISRMSDQYFALALDHPAEHRQATIIQRHHDQDRKSWDMHTGVRNNKLQEHFRQQLRQ